MWPVPWERDAKCWGRGHTQMKEAGAMAGFRKRPCSSWLRGMGRWGFQAQWNHKQKHRDAAVNYEPWGAVLMERPRWGCERSQAHRHSNTMLRNLDFILQAMRQHWSFVRKGEAKEGSPKKTWSRTTNPEPHRDCIKSFQSCQGGKQEFIHTIGCKRLLCPARKQLLRDANLVILNFDSVASVSQKQILQSFLVFF